VSERGIELMTIVSRQLDEMAGFFGALDEADLRKPCPDDDAGDTVGAVAAHAAEVYHYLGRFLRATGHVPGSPATGNSQSHGHGRASPELLPHLPDLLDRLTAGKAPIGLLADLTDEQLDSVPPAGSGRFSNGRRSLAGTIDAVIAYQATHLVMLKRAVAGDDLGDNHTHDTPHACRHDGEKHIHTHTRHEHVEHNHDHDGDSHDKDAAVRARHHPGLQHISHVRECPRGFLSKKHAGLLAIGGGAFTILHFAGGVIIHVVLPILVGAAIWQGVGGTVAGSLVVGMLVVGVVLYLEVRRRLAKSAKEST
jgi:hypothetical protein